jgi:hypothetical protein
MNERIKQFAEQVGAVRNVLAMGRHDGVLFTEFELEKFAELIVRECVKEMSEQMYWHHIDEANNPNFYKAVEKTLKYFGVET